MELSKTKGNAAWGNSLSAVLFPQIYTLQSIVSSPALRIFLVQGCSSPAPWSTTHLDDTFNNHSLMAHLSEFTLQILDWNRFCSGSACPIHKHKANANYELKETVPSMLNHHSHTPTVYLSLSYPSESHLLVHLTQPIWLPHFNFIHWFPSQSAVPRVFGLPLSYSLTSQTVDSTIKQTTCRANSFCPYNLESFAPQPWLLRILSRFATAALQAMVSDAIRAQVISFHLPGCRMMGF